MSRTPRRPGLAAMAVMVVVVLVVLGLVTGWLQAGARKGLYASGLLVDGGASTIDPNLFPAAEKPQPPAEPGAVLAPATPRPGTQPAKVAERFAQAGNQGGRVFAEVIDGSTGQELYSRDGSGAGTPASTLKTLTTSAALQAYGPDHRFSTRVLRDPAANRIHLVGGGDPYLTRTAGADSLRALAESSAGALGRTPVEVVVDSTLFAGPSWNPEWVANYHDYVADTSALWVDGARRTPNAIGPRETDPAQAAGQFFADELKRLGVPVTAINRDQAPAQGPELAKVVSMPLENIVESVLQHSDNDAAEVLFRHLGRTGGRGGSIADSQAALQQILTELGAWTPGMKVVDGSGLARGNLVSPKALTAVVQRAVSGDGRLRAIVTGMSIAGVEGTLAERFVEPGTREGRGIVRAKSGTLTKVHSLAGYARDADGSLLIFSIIVNDDPDDYGARVWLDKVTTSLTNCGCSG